MKYLYIFLISGIGLASCSAVNTLSPVQFREKMLSGQNIVIIDVRTPEEYAEGHLPNAINIDYKNDSFKQEVEKLDKSVNYYVYCKGGGRSLKAAKLMKKSGFESVSDMGGGITAWKEAGFEIEE